MGADQGEMYTMESRHVETLKDFAYEQSGLGAPPVNRRVLLALESFGRERLSTSFFMRDFLHSEISAVYGIPNIPSDPELAVEAGRGLCTQLLEPLHRTFGQVVVRSAFRSRAVNAYGNEHSFSCATNESNRAKHIWDWRDGDDLVGATACIVIPWFIDTGHYKETRDWRPLAWYIHDHLPYSEMVFFAKNAAFNLTWRERKPRRRILGHAQPHKGLLTKPGHPNHSGDHSPHYPGFPKLRS